MNERNWESVRDHPSLLLEGWERRHIAAPDRAKEWVDLYVQLGFKVKAVNLTPEDFGDVCSACGIAADERYVLIYVQKPDGGNTLSI